MIAAKIIFIGAEETPYIAWILVFPGYFSLVCIILKAGG